MPAPQSFCPPALPDVGANYPDRALLTVRGYIADRRNATTAASFTSEGYPIQVTFCCAASPPALSHICVHCPAAPSFFVEPQLLASQGNLVLLLVSIGSDPVESSCDYLVYRADGRPSLDLLPDPGHNITRANVGLVPSAPGGRSGGYTVVTLTPDFESKRFTLWLYREKTRQWHRKVVPRKPSPAESSAAEGNGKQAQLKPLPFSPSKVTALPGSSTIAWVDLRRAVVLCDVLAKHAVAEYIPLPEPLSDGNREFLESIAVPAFLRDAIGQKDGSIRFVEMEYRYDQPGFVPNGGEP